MKSSISIALLLLYATYALRSILPYLEYSINYDFISQELCINLDDDLSACNGKCYLNSQIKLFVGEQDSNQGVPLESRAEVKDVSHTFSSFRLSNQLLETERANYTVSNSRFRYNVILELTTPPPEKLS